MKATAASTELPIHRKLHAEDVIRREEDEHELQHERRTAHDRNVETEQIRDRAKTAHAPQRHEHAKRKCADERNEEELQRNEKALAQHSKHCGEFHIRTLSKTDR